MKKLIALVLIAGSASAANATVVNVDANPGQSAEIRPDGVRQFAGDVSRRFWNPQEAGGNFSTVAVVQFDASAIAALVGPGADQIGSVTLSLFQDPAAFTTANADVAFYYGSNDLPITLAGLSGVTFSNALASFGAQPINSSYLFSRGSFGTLDSVSLFGEGLSGESAFANNLLSGGTITILAVATSGIASWGGAEPTAGLPLPSLSVTLVPAPGAVALLGLGGLVVARRRR